jgi:hypothetical protein
MLYTSIQHVCVHRPNSTRFLINQLVAVGCDTNLANKVKH